MAKLKFSRWCWFLQYEFALFVRLLCVLNNRISDLSMGRVLQGNTTSYVTGARASDRCRYFRLAHVIGLYKTNDNGRNVLCECLNCSSGDLFNDGISV